MNKLNLVISIISIATLISCHRTDFSNPEEVIKNYRYLSSENKNEILYDDFLSSKSKEFVTNDEFVKARNTPDSISKSTKLLESKFSSFPLDINNPTYRRFKVDEKFIFKKDTIYNRLYYSLINENGKWKVVWTNTLLAFAARKYSDGNYSEARKTLEKIIEINPFSGEAYQILAWCYYRDKSLPASECENGIVKNAKYAVNLEEDICSHYNTLAAYYSSKGNVDLAIQNLERGLSFCLNNSDKTMFYSNLVGSYISTENFKKAEECIKKSIEINDKDAFVWFKYGTLMRVQGNNLMAKKYLEIALKQAKMENALQGGLYYLYAACCFDDNECDKAREFVNKALDIEPNNYDYQFLYNRIKYCNEKTK